MKRNLVIISLALVAVVFIVVGIISGEASIVLRNATNICLSCLGIG